MTPRAAAGLGRLLPLLLVAAAVVIVAGTALLAACGVTGGSSGGSGGGASGTPATATASVATQPRTSASSSSTAAGTTTLGLYFLRDGDLGVAERRVPKTATVATAALKTLLAGPTAEETAAGLSTAIPAGSRLASLSIGGGLATVDLSSEFAGGSAGESMGQRAAEVVYTLTRFPTVDRVA
jgi:spore germination protein GerM